MQEEQGGTLPSFNFFNNSSCNLDFRRSPLGIIFREVTKEIPRDSKTTFFTLFISKNKVSEDNKDQRLSLVIGATFVGHLHMLWKEGQAYLSKVFNIIDILLYPVSTIELSMVGPGEKISNIKVLSWLENAILIKILANIVQIIPLIIQFFNYKSNVNFDNVLIQFYLAFLKS